MNKKRTRISLLAMAVASGSVMAGYAASAGTDAGATAGADATAIAGSAQVRTLPIEQYLPTPAEFAKLSQAGGQLQQKCMQGLGFAAFQAPEQAPADPRETFTDLRYGTVDAAQAARSGYKPEFAASARTAKAGGASAAAADGPAPSGAVEPVLSDAEWLAMTGTTKDVGDNAKAKQAAPSQVQGKDVPPGGCIAESARTLTGGSEKLYADLAQDINGQSFKESLKDPRVTKAFASWSACMKGKGYSYKDPMQANDDPKFAVPTVSAEEIAVASADVACKNKTKLVDVWHSAEAQIQQRMIDAKATEMGTIKKAKQTALSKAQGAS
ncbi:hypothetical protein [Streptomyces sp. NRRL F-2580]|uniref:hypothetical protein n=1 Tax=Streptomyces sp. NRRL F-2580 TaxID=1463841 RepID=UPI0006903F13|nr:hypothetical protein [Streptomyces sp. NRRL F-2580]